ncbi:MAG: hypothetical protein V1892_00490 [bacterium]
MKKIKLYDFEGDGKTVNVSLKALFSGAGRVSSCGQAVSGKIRKKKRLDQKQKEKRNERNE